MKKIASFLDQFSAFYCLGLKVCLCIKSIQEILCEKDSIEFISCLYYDTTSKTVKNQDSIESVQITAMGGSDRIPHCNSRLWLAPASHHG